MLQKTLNSLRSGEWLYAGADSLPDIARLLAECSDTCHELNSMRPSMKSERYRLLHELLGSIGANVTIHSPFRCDFGFNIHIGDNFKGNFNLTILDEAEVHIGNNVMIGPNCSLITITHALNHDQRNDGIMAAKPITIGNDVWIAANVVILPGVTIGDRSVIGAGSVVTKSIPADVLAVGNPCRPIRPITDVDRVTII